MSSSSSSAEPPRRHTARRGSLLDLHPYPRGAPPGLPFRWDARTDQRGLNFTLVTDLGDLDLLGEIVGGGTYENLLPDCLTIELFGVACQCLGLERLIEVKRAAGRPKDLEAIAELETILENRPPGESQRYFRQTRKSA